MREIDKATIFEMQRDVNYVITFMTNVQVCTSAMRLTWCNSTEGKARSSHDWYELERKDFPQLVELLQQANGQQAFLQFGIQLKTERSFWKENVQNRNSPSVSLWVWPDDTPVGLNGCGLLVILGSSLNKPIKPYNGYSLNARNGWSRRCTLVSGWVI